MEINNVKREDNFSADEYVNYVTSFCKKENLLGKGGYGEVYRGKFNVLGVLKEVAIKRIPRIKWRKHPKPNGSSSSATTTCWPVPKSWKINIFGKLYTIRYGDILTLFQLFFMIHHYCRYFVLELASGTMLDLFRTDNNEKWKRTVLEPRVVHSRK